MKAAIVLLADSAVQNYARRIVFDLNTRWQAPFYVALLPSHVSLKQPFVFEDIDVLEAYFDGLAARIPPLEVALDGMYCGAWTGYGILGLNVVESPALRGLHNLLNTELPVLFKDTRAPFDGSEYRFHLTIEMGRTGQINPYQAYFDAQPSHDVKLRFTARELALFFYPDDGNPPQSFITYRVRPLEG